MFRRLTAKMMKNVLKLHFLLTSGDHSISVPLGTEYPSCVVPVSPNGCVSGSLLPSGLVEFDDDEPSFFFLLPPKQPRFSPINKQCYY